MTEITYAQAIKDAMCEEMRRDERVFIAGVDIGNRGGTDGETVINNGVTRATRIAKLSPGTFVGVEVIDDLPIPVGLFPSIGDLMP